MPPPLAFAARWLSKEPVLNDEHDDFIWRTPDGLGDLRMTSGLEAVVAAARRLLRA